MKKLIILCVVCIGMGINPLLAQNAENKWGLGAHFGVMEYNGDYANQFYSFSQGYAVGASISRYLSPSFDLMGHFFYDRAHSGDYGRLNQPTWLGFEADMFNLNLLAKYKFNNGHILKESAKVAPFILGGLGGNYASTSGTGQSGAFSATYLNPNIYAGLGVNFRLSSAISLVIQSSFMTPFNDKIDGWYPDVAQNKVPEMFLENSFGIYITPGKGGKKDKDGDGVPDKLDKCPDTPAGVPVDAQGCPLDSDKDGILDYQDECPMVAGLKEFNGCPDTDKDGIPDKSDECPDVYGLAAFKGCPDTDGDGIQDKDDRCPNTPKGQKVDRFGCPLDSDRDGIPDTEDQCPDKPGLPELKGCPVTGAYLTEKYGLQMKPIYFDYDSSVLKPEGIDALDRIANALNKYRDFGVQFDGHTCSMGTDEYNLNLSEKRALSAREYLIKKGIVENQIRLQYFGESKPASNNASFEGRRLNRRVEYNLFEIGK